MRGKKVGVQATRFRTVNLNAARLRPVLARAPREFTVAARRRPLVVSLPAPNGAFQRFAIAQSAIMSPGLAKRHPEIKTYRGVGLTDPTATIHADLSPLGFHASVRSSHGAWYIDPYFIGRTPSVYASYYGRDARNANAAFVERESHLAELSVDKGYYHASDTVTLNGSGFAENGSISIEISDPTENARHAHSDGDLELGGLVRDLLRRRPGREARRSHRRGLGRDVRGARGLPGRPRRRPDERPAHRRPSCGTTGSR